MTLKQNQAVHHSGPVTVQQLDLGTDSTLGAAVTPNTGATLTFDRMRPIRHARLTLASFSIAVDESDDFGGTKLCDLPDSNIMLMGVEVDLTMVKAGTTNGLEATVDLDVGVGTAVASAQTLATTMIDIIEKADLDTDSLTVEFEAHSQDQSTASTPIKIADGASSALYLNVGVPAGITVSDTISVSGTVDLFYVDLGNVIS